MANIIKCKACGDVIESKHRHDFRTCKCGEVSVDGGNDYQRILWTAKKPLEECVEFVSSPEHGPSSQP